jgi:hypothetical protein
MNRNDELKQPLLNGNTGHYVIDIKSPAENKLTGVACIQNQKLKGLILQSEACVNMLRDYTRIEIYEFETKCLTFCRKEDSSRCYRIGRVFGEHFLLFIGLGYMMSSLDSSQWIELSKYGIVEAALLMNPFFALYFMGREHENDSELCNMRKFLTLKLGLEKNAIRQRNQIVSDFFVSFSSQNTGGLVPHLQLITEYVPNMK